MTEAQLLDALAQAIDSKREKGRLKRIRETFAEYTKHKTKPRWWRIWRITKKGMKEA